MNSAWEQDLAACRANLAGDPDGAAVQAGKLLEKARTNGERLRAHLTFGFAHALRNRLDKCRDEFERAAKYRRPGPLARSELAGHWSQLHILNGDLDSAAIEADRAVKLAQPLALRSPRVRSRYKPTSVLPRTAYAAALLARAEVRLCQGVANEALSDVKLALSWVEPRFSVHVYIAGLTLLGRTLITPGVATPRLAHQVLKICRQAQRILAARKIRSNHPNRVKVRGLEALALGTLGSLERADKLLTKTIMQLKDSGLEFDARLMAEYMIWLLEHRAGQIGRARALALRYGLPVGEVIEPRDAPEEDESPIGF